MQLVYSIHALMHVLEESKIVFACSFGLDSNVVYQCPVSILVMYFSVSSTGSIYLIGNFRFSNGRAGFCRMASIKPTKCRKTGINRDQDEHRQ